MAIVSRTVVSSYGDRMIKISVRLFNHNEKTHVETLLKNLMKRFGESFSLAPSASADAILVSPHDPGFETLVRMKSSNKSPLVVVYDNQSQMDGCYFLEKPATSNGLMKLHRDLSAACKNLLEGHSNVHPDNANNKLWQEAGLIDQIKQAYELQNCSVISSAKNSQLNIIVDGINQQVYVPVGNVSGSDIHGELLTLLNEQSSLAAEPISHKQLLERLDNSAYEQFSFEKILWILASFSADVCRLSDQRVIALRAWPDFSNLPYTHSFVKMTALLMRQPASISALAKQSGLPELQVKKFVFACLVTELAEVADQPNVTQTVAIPTPSVGRDIVNKIKQRFFGKRAYA